MNLSIHVLCAMYDCSPETTDNWPRLWHRGSGMTKDALCLRYARIKQLLRSRCSCPSALLEHRVKVYAHPLDNFDTSSIVAFPSSHPFVTSFDLYVLTSLFSANRAPLVSVQELAVLRRAHCVFTRVQVVVDIVEHALRAATHNLPPALPLPTLGDAVKRKFHRCIVRPVLQRLAARTAVVHYIRNC